MSEHLKALKAQHADLADKIAAAELAHKASAIAQVKAVMAEHGLSLADVAGSPSAVKSSGSRVGKKTGKVAPKYRNTAGDTWSGRGMKPTWLTAALANGLSIDEFKIAA